VAVIIWCLDLQLPVHSVSITIKVVSSNPIQHYVLKFVNDRSWFSPGPPFSSTTNKTDRHKITEILLKVALNTINQQ